MKTGRTERIGEEIRREVTTIINFELEDPRLEGVQVSNVKMSADLGLARVYFTLPEQDLNKKKIEETLRLLRGTASFLRRKIAEVIRMKLVPKFDFCYDETLELQKNMDRLFKEIEARRDES